jgi:cytochrome c biogenesis protein CcmG/thiol:disulfide interchange protein DsbE
LPSTQSSSTGAERAGRGRTIRLAAFVLIVLAVPLSLVVQRIVDPADRLDPRHSGPAPTFALRSLDGESVSLDSLRGRPVVVNFWGGWCEQCRLQLPLLAEMHRRHPDVVIVGILFREDPEIGRAAAAKGDATWPTLLDPDERVATAYGVDSAPATFFIGAAGTIAGHLVGPVSIGILDTQFRRITRPS